MNAPHLCEATICLTLRGQNERQAQAAEALRAIGVDAFDFYYGRTPSDQDVVDAFASGRVKRYPPCFRCGQEVCDSPNCNNVLLPVQVAVSLSFQGILQHCVDRGLQTAAVCEDDVVFAAYARQVFESPSYRALLDESGLFSNSPTLLRLGGPGCPDGFFDEASFSGVVSASSEARVSNYFFLVNHAFARLAATRMDELDHTADVLIHLFLTEQANCVTLVPQIACDRSWALRTEPSLIHPKPEYLAHLGKTVGETSLQYQREAMRLKRHRKVAKMFDYGFAGINGCDFDRLSAACQRRGIDIDVHKPGNDGLASWRFKVKADPASLSDWVVDTPYFIHVRQHYWLVPEPFRCLAGLERAIDGQDADTREVWASLESSIKMPSSMLDSSIAIATAMFVSWYRFAMVCQPAPIVFEQDFDASLAQVLDGRERPSPLVRADDLAALRQRIPPRLADEFVLALGALGFRIAGT